MPTDEPANPPAARHPPSLREAKRAEALRANLLRRKAQARARQEPPEPDQAKAEPGDA